VLEASSYRPNSPKKKAKIDTIPQA